MKRVLFISIFAALSIICSAQEAYKLSSVIQAEGKSSEQIYSAVKSWSLKALRSVKDAQQMDDPEAKILSYRISADYSYGSFSMTEGQHFLIVTDHLDLPSSPTNPLTASLITTSVEWCSEMISMTLKNCSLSIIILCY